MAIFALLTIFAFRTDDVWLNLHQFLYVLGRHEIQHRDRTRAAQANAPKDEAEGFARLSPEEQHSTRRCTNGQPRSRRLPLSSRVCRTKSRRRTS